MRCSDCQAEAEPSRKRCRLHLDLQKAATRRYYARNPRTNYEHVKAWRATQADRRRRYERDREARLRREVVAAYGGACSCCGETYSPYLELDHVNGDGAEHRRAVGHGKAMHSWLKRNGFPLVIQLLCGNCHNAKSRHQPCQTHAR